MSFKGIYTALITPFTVDGGIDWSAFKKILDDQIAAKVSGVVVCGTTGETPTLDEGEFQKLVQTTVQHLRGSSLQVLVGTGSASTQLTIQRSRAAESEGANGLLVVTPFYNKPTQDGLLHHYAAVADAVKKIPIMLYNVPGRTGVSLSAQTVAQLSLHPRIRAIKEASGNITAISEIREKLKMRQTSGEFQILSGDDVTFLAALTLGATGVVSVASHLFPRAMVQLYLSFQEGDLERARQIHDQYFPLFRDLFVESNPAPVKAALAKLGVCLDQVRLPLVSLSDSGTKILEQSMAQCGVEKWHL